MGSNFKSETALPFVCRVSQNTLSDWSRPAQIQGFAKSSSLILLFCCGSAFRLFLFTNPENIMTNTSTATKRVTCQLQAIISDEPNTIRAYVAQEAFRFGGNNPAEMFTGLAQHGCISGWIDSLIYYTDTHNFYDRFYDEIEDLRSDYEDSIGEPLRVTGDLKNWFAWFAFEETAYRIANDDFGLEL